MKKFLLSAALMMMACVSVFAATDGQTYEPVNGIKIVNKWILDRVHTPTVFPKMDICNTRARTAALSGDVVYIARSEAVQTIPAPGDTVAQSVIYRLDANTGAELTPLYVTLDGKPYGAFLGVNSIGCDNFGHLWVAPYTSEKTAEIPFYQLNAETGELTLLATLSKGDKIARTDYYDVMGDITRENAECNIMNAGTQVSTVYRWHADQGAEEFEGGFEGDISLEITAFFPETVVGWNYGPIVKMCLGESEDNLYSGELFYVDGFNSVPALYDVTGSLIDSFEEAPTELYPEAGTNGVAEFVLDGRNFMTYSLHQYAGAGHGCEANIVELGEGMSLGGMSKYWQIPADSLGQVSDGGNRVHCLSTVYGTEGGEDCVTLLDFKSYNGVAVYKIGKGVSEGGEEPLKGDLNGDGVVNSADIAVLVDALLASASDAKYDLNADGAVNSADVGALVNILLGE